MRILVILVCVIIQAQASIFDWLSPFSERARRAQLAMEEFGPLVEQAISDYKVPGVAIGVVVDGQLVYAKGFGFRDVEKKSPVTKETIFQIGSCTKAFSAFTIAKLVEEGLLHWDQKVIDVYPEFRLYDSYATQNLTFRDLLTHRSGMARHDFMWYNSSWTKTDVMQRLRFLEPCCNLRERYVYNNLMYFAAGYAVEYATDTPWETLVQEKVLKPLEMHSTGFVLDDMLKTGNFACPYIEKEGRMEKMGSRDLRLIGAAGALHSNVVDLSHWVQMQLGGGVYKGSLMISPSLLQELHAPQVIVPGAPETKESQIYAYGMGWCVAAYRGQYFLSHDGVSDGLTSTIVLLPLQNVGVIVLCNRNFTCFPRFLSCQIVDRVLELPSIDWLSDGLEGLQKGQMVKTDDQEHLRRKGTMPSHALEEFVGAYEHPGYGTLTLDLVDGQLCASFHGIVSTLEHWHYDVFRIASENQNTFFSRVGTKLTFRNNLDGDVAELTVPFEPNVDDICFKKIKRPQGIDAGYQKLLGFYEIYGYTVEIVMRNHALCALIPGQPVYELVPGAENEFTVKSMAGYNLRFVLGQDGQVQEVLLMQPYGTFTARPKKPIL